MTDQTRTTEAPPNAGLSLSGYPHVAARIFNTPLLIAPDKMQAVLFGLQQSFDLRAIAAPADAALMQPAASVGRWEGSDRRLGMIIDKGVAILPVTGTLVNRGAWVGTSSGLQSYEGIAQQVRAAAEDDRVHTLLLDMNSYGGEAGGVSDLAAEIRELAESKRVVAFLSDAAASAAYWIAAAATEIVTTDTGLAGSIGVVLTHQEMTGAAEKAGVKITQVHAGAEKLLGSPFRPLSEGDRGKLQTEVNQIYELFVERVAAYRGVDASQIRETEAAVYRGAKALRAGLADRVMSGRALLTELQSRSPSGARRITTGSHAMSQQEQAGAAAPTTITEAQHTQAVAAAKAEGMKAGASAERDRVKAILTSEAATGRTELAHHLAFDTDMSAEASVALLGKSPAAPAAKSGLDAAMEAFGTAGIAAQEVEAATDAPVRLDSHNIYAARRQAGNRQ